MLAALPVPQNAPRLRGFTVTAEVMKRLSELGDRVDVYFPG